MNDLATRNRLLVAQADLHRQLVTMERTRLGARWETAGSFLDQNRWWLIGGAALGGVLFVRNWRGLAQWLPMLVTTWRALKK